MSLQNIYWSTCLSWLNKRCLKICFQFMLTKFLDTPPWGCGTWWASNVFHRSWCGTDPYAFARSSHTTYRLSRFLLALWIASQIIEDMLDTTGYTWNASLLDWNVYVLVRHHELREPRCHDGEKYFPLYIQQRYWSELVQTFGVFLLWNIDALCFLPLIIDRGRRPRSLNEGMQQI